MINDKTDWTQFAVCLLLWLVQTKPVIFCLKISSFMGLCSHSVTGGLCRVVSADSIKTTTPCERQDTSALFVCLKTCFCCQPNPCCSTNSVKKYLAELHCPTWSWLIFWVIFYSEADCGGGHVGWEIRVFPASAQKSLQTRNVPGNAKMSFIIGNRFPNCQWRAVNH